MRILLLIFALALTSLSACTLFTTPISVEHRTMELPVQLASAADTTDARSTRESSTLRVLSLNMAHGRKDSFSQFFVSTEATRENLAEIAAFLKRENADIVTLQEADEASLWSGNFDHVELLAREAGYTWFAHGSHVDNTLGTYGTAVLSRFPMTNGYQVDFNPTPPTTRKGFTLAEIEWSPGSANGEKLIIDVVSVHLDFSRSSKRIEQIEDMKEILGQRSNPTIVLGDFNSTWFEGDGEIQALAKVRKLKTHRPEANRMFTYSEDRFDWILVSKEFEFCNYYAAADILSDHRAVVSDVGLIDEGSKAAECEIL